MVQLGYVMIRGNSDYLVNPMKKDVNGVWVYPANIPSADFTSCVLKNPELGL